MKYSCVVLKAKVEKINNTENNVAIISNLTKIIESQKDTINNGIQAFMDNNKKTQELAEKNMDNFKFIMKYFADAPNLELPDDIEEKLYQSMPKYIVMRDPEEAIATAILDHITVKPQEERSIHGIDFSRSKYVIKYNGKWQVEYHATKFVKKFIKVMHKVTNKVLAEKTTEMSNSQALAAIDLIDTMQVKKTTEIVSKKIFGTLKLNKEQHLIELLREKK